MALLDEALSDLRQSVAALEHRLEDCTAERDEALAQQTATSEIFRAIARSPTDVQPVFETIVGSAARMCYAEFSAVVRFDDGLLHLMALHRMSPEESTAFHSLFPRPPTRNFVMGRAFADAVPVHFEDVLAEPDYDARTREVLQTVAGYRSFLSVPILREGKPIGAIGCGRRAVKPFTATQIDLLETFANQAAIAIENVRLFNELKTRNDELAEALEQQTAIAEVLQVINNSPGELAPVFDAMLENALRLCEIDIGTLWTYDGEMVHAAAIRGAPPRLTEFLRQGPHRPAKPQQRVLGGERVVQIADITTTEAYQNGDPVPRAIADLGGVRTLLIVPLRKEDTVLGNFAIYRCEVRPFTDKQIALLQNFAAQAVIAMENARLLDEIRQRQAELRVTFDNMADGVVMFDEDLRLAEWNRNFQELLDLPGALLAEHPNYSDYLRILAARGEFGTEDIEAEVSRRLENTDQEFRQERTRPDGRAIEVRRNAVPDGGFVLIYSDVTERKRSEAEIRAARDAAEGALAELRTAQASLIHAEKMASLGQLTAGIAHEIKNPLNFVNNFAGLSVELLDELTEAAAPGIATLDEETQAEIDETVVMLTGNLEKIAEHGKRADGIVKSMLEHSRGGSTERRSVDLNALVEEALNLAYHGARAQDRSFSIDFEKEYDGDLRRIELAPQEITRVFLNLFGNGFYAANKRARENGDSSFRPTLTVATHDLGDAVEVRVRDNGTGISPDIRGRLFQPFFTTKPTGEGTGLGLSISYDIVTQQHAGTISVESEPGAFTEFTVRLPRH